MTVTPTPGIAAAWSAAKVAPDTRPVVQPEAGGQAKTVQVAAAAETGKSPPAPKGQGAQVDVRV